MYLLVSKSGIGMPIQLQDQDIILWHFKSTGDGCTTRLPFLRVKRVVFRQCHRNSPSRKIGNGFKRHVGKCRFSKRDCMIPRVELKSHMPCCDIALESVANFLNKLLKEICDRPPKDGGF